MPAGIRREQLVWLLILILFAMPWCMAFAQIAMPRIQLKAGTRVITAEVAATLASRDQGLMHRHSLPADRGMLFVFPEARRHCMWMRNTHIPLSVAFLDDKGIIVNIAEMRPDTEDLHCAAMPVRYALEMNEQWFQGNSLFSGSRIDGLEKAPTGR